MAAPDPPGGHFYLKNSGKSARAIPKRGFSAKEFDSQLIGFEDIENSFNFLQFILVGPVYFSVLQKH